jgi:hypothetical protein
MYGRVEVYLHKLPNHSTVVNDGNLKNAGRKAGKRRSTNGSR